MHNEGIVQRGDDVSSYDFGEQNRNFDKLWRLG